MRWPRSRRSWSSLGRRASRTWEGDGRGEGPAREPARYEQGVGLGEGGFELTLRPRAPSPSPLVSSPSTVLQALRIKFGLWLKSRHPSAWRCPAGHLDFARCDRVEREDGVQLGRATSRTRVGKDV